MSGSNSLVLSLLRQAIQNNVPISLEGEDLMIGSSKFPRKTKTPYRSKKGKGSLYELDTIWFWLQHEKAKFSVYFREARKNKIGTVSVEDQAEVSDYMRGRKDTCEYLEASTVDPEAFTQEVHEQKLDEKQQIDEQPLDIAGIQAQERAIHTRESIMLARKPLDSVLKMFDDTINNSKKSSSSSDRKHSRSDPRKGSLSSSGNTKRRRLEHGPDAKVPIIIVPAATTSLITLYNAKQFLGQGGFQPSESLRSQGKPKQPIEIQRQSVRDPKTNVRFHIVDDVKLVKNWDRVVAVFVTGQNWQFKGFKWKTPVEILANIQGFHCHWGDEPVVNNIKKWRVLYMPIMKTMRHNDRGEVINFWKKLHERISQDPNKSFLEI